MFIFEYIEKFLASAYLFWHSEIMRWILYLIPFYIFSGSLSDKVFVKGYKDGKSPNFLTRTDNIPPGQLSKAEDTYLEGYIQALIDTHYYELGILVLVKDRKVYLYNMPNSYITREALISFVRDLPDIESVEVKEGAFPEPGIAQIESRAGRERVSGIWFPESTVLFQPLIANPRTPNYSLAYRFGSDFLAKDTVAVSLGDFFPIFRFNNIGAWEADLQIDFAACVWTVFNMDAPNGRGNEWARLDNSDYLAALPISLAFGRWSFRLTFYHISTHLGDEYICNLLYANQPVIRVNQVLRFWNSWHIVCVTHDSKTFK